MLLTRILLVNIRSYKKQEIHFSQGITLLAGDIGAGKSTILLAIEFALFGIMRGTIAGTALLRHGAPTGMAELDFTINNIPYTIRRVLKHSSNTIEQESGYLITNGQRKDGTATELKSWILTILGYPPELLTKNKTLLYRYTVYTPQEEMKHILNDTPENRLEVLTKIFNIDKYKHIKENTSIYTRKLRERIKLLEGQTIDIDEKIKKQAELTNESAMIEKQLTDLRTISDQLANECTNQQQKLTELEQQAQQALTKQKTCEFLTTIIASTEQTLNNDAKELANITATITQLQQEISTHEQQYDEKQHQHVQQQHSAIEQQLTNITHETGKITALHEQHYQTQKNIASLNTCPVCQQNVTHEHKKNIIAQQQSALKILHEKLTDLNEQKKSLEQVRKNHQEEERNHQNLKQQTQLKKLKEKHLQEQQQRKNHLETKIKNQQQETENKKTQLALAQQESAALTNTAKQYETAKKTFLEKQQKYHEHTITLTRQEERQTNISKQITEIQQTITAKKEQQQQCSLLKKKENWLTNHFTTILDKMERTVFARTWNELNTNYTQWFSTLLEDDMLTTRLDDTCTPIIQQNGHETTIDNLSGGEKTACALAYRLALNNAINNLMTTITTKDTIILDEPTDGFSTEQLDKLKDVLDTLNTKQIIIVSHEKKIEGFVDHIINISKKNHVSEISTTISTA